VRKQPTPPPEGIVKPPPPPGPPGTHWFQKADRGKRRQVKTPVQSNPLVVTTLVYLHLGKQGLRDMITAVHDYEEKWLKPLTGEDIE